jgi:hypothetical protein
MVGICCTKCPKYFAGMKVLDLARASTVESGGTCERNIEMKIMSCFKLFK